MIYTQEQLRQHNLNLQVDLRELGLFEGLQPLVALSGMYDTVTHRAVAQFQRQHGMRITGNTDLLTWDAIVAAANASRARRANGIPVRIFPWADYLVQPGDSGRLVYIVQSLINGVVPHFPSIPAVPYSGEYGEETIAAVRELQRVLSLPDSGIMDSFTWDGLSALYTNYGNRPPLDWML